MRRCFILGLLAVTAASLWGAETPYQLLKNISLPGDGGWDYLTMDSSARRLYITHGTRVQVFQVDQEKLIGEIRDTPGVHGVALAADLGRGFTSNGGDDTVTVFDLRSLKTLSRIKIKGRGPDAIVYDPATRRVFAFNGRSGTATALDAATGEPAGEIVLNGKPEFAVADGKGNLYLNLVDASELLKIDAKQLRVTARWNLAPCEEPTALALDPENGRAFAGCRNKIMVVVDVSTGRLVATVGIGEYVDAGVFDPATRRVFMANGEGTL